MEQRMMAGQDSIHGLGGQIRSPSNGGEATLANAHGNASLK
jgi:hypothetical protein